MTNAAIRRSSRARVPYHPVAHLPSRSGYNQRRVEWLSRCLCASKHGRDDPVARHEGHIRSLCRGPRSHHASGARIAHGRDPLSWTSSERRLRCPHRWQSTPKRRRPRRQFDDDFKAQAVRLVLDEGKSVGAVARDLDLTETALRACGAACACQSHQGPDGPDDGRA